MLTSPGSSQRSVTAAGSEGLWDLTADKINSKVICAEAATEATGGDGGGREATGWDVRARPAMVQVQGGAQR